ncbi:MAG: YigZ family protein [Clostridia bacterium]|nr:YigZ family protein [Clostridia bacterium]
MAEFVPYETVDGEVCAEFIEKKSRFIGLLAPVKTEAEALAFIAAQREKYPGATHYVHAYVLRENNTLRFADDGEPSGTAGKPALEVLVREGITDVVSVVVRYFGGILLGAGGLVRAYARSARDAVAAACRVRMVPCVRFSLTVSYAAWQRISRILPTYGVREESLDYGAEICLCGNVETGEFDALSEAVREHTAGAVLPVRLEDGIRPREL